MRQIAFFAFLIVCLLSFAAFGNISKTEQLKPIHHSIKTQPLGVSIILYRVGKADKIEDLSGLEKQMEKSKSVDLYKVTQDLAIIFLNTADPYSDTSALPYKMLYGNYVEKQVGDRIINGFLSTSDVSKVSDWMKKYNIDRFEGFSKLYDHLSEESKQALEDIGAEDKKSLFDGYVEPMTKFYFDAVKEGNSIVICGE